MAEVEYLTVDEALSAVLESANVLSPVDKPLLDSLGCVLAKSIISGDNLPPFANSSMDGYAVRSEDVALASQEAPTNLSVVADISAGVVNEIRITQGSAARIMTGAVIPDGADAVVPVEMTDEPWRNSQRSLPELIKVRHTVSSGDYIRLPGEDIEAGAEVLPAGRLLRAQEIGILASLGYAQVSVIRQPIVGILATGDELVQISESLQPGKIRNSNSYAIAAQVISSGALPLLLGIATDNQEDVRLRLQQGLDENVDLFVSSAGVSVGAYDVVRSVLEQEGQIRFWRVRMRPGKPLAFGRYGGVPYLGLPGNPVSALVSFERFARPAILKMAGKVNWIRPTVNVIVSDEIQSDGRESYVRAVVERGPIDYYARPLGKQGSHMMTSLTEANALIIVPEGIKMVAAGEKLAAMMLDWPETVF